MSSIPKYLDRYAEAEARDISAFPRSILDGHWERIVVLPLCGEFSPDLLLSLNAASVKSQTRALVIAVVNERRDSLEEYKRRNAQMLQWFANQPSLSSLTIFPIDRTDSNCFPPKEGVGLARKLGCDVGLALIHAGVSTSPYLWTTDGDARVDENYFDISNEPESAALLSPFQHAYDLKTLEGRALKAYDSFLHYYVAGLKYAGSPYAFHTIGSTIIVAAEAYAQVRGFPKREAGEDFYLLNKVAKVGCVRVRSTGVVTLSQRSSLRVPFGTGSSTVDIMQLFSAGETYRIYHPATFECLRIWLEAMDRFCIHQDLAQTRDEIALENAKLLPIIEKLSLFSILESAKATRKEERRIRAHCREAFDAFRTLKFVHAVRDEVVGEIPWQDAITQMEAKTLSGQEGLIPFPRLRSCETPNHMPA